jgi:hypothetical protein
MVYNIRPLWNGRPKRTQRLRSTGAKQSGSSKEQSRQHNYNVTLWRIRVTILAVEGQQCILCVVELHVAVNHIKIPSAAQKYFFWQIYVAGNNETYVKCPKLH